MNVNNLSLSDLSKATIHYGLTKGKIASRDVTILVGESKITCKMQDLLKHVEKLSEDPQIKSTELLATTQKLSSALNEGDQAVTKANLTNLEKLVLRFRKKKTPDHAKRIEKLASRCLPSTYGKNTKPSLLGMGFYDIFEKLSQKDIDSYIETRRNNPSAVQNHESLTHINKAYLVRVLDKNDSTAHLFLKDLHKKSPLLVLMALDLYGEKGHHFLLEKELAERALKL